jgi:predicted AAA+ superfamily ATPase
VPRGQVVVVDEVQRVPAVLNEVHRAIEGARRRFVLLGSSARKLKTANTNLLAGRATVQTMFPLTPAELGADFDLERVLRYGSIPLVWQSDDPRATLEAYGQLYLREEIRAEALVRNLPGFLRFLPVAAMFHGQVINISGLARDAATARTTVEGYIGILQDTLLATTLPAFEARLRVRERQHPKLYWVDPGVVRAIKRQLGPVTAEERGPLLAGWVLMLLRAHNQDSMLFEEVAYWAPTQARQTEVDFLLRRGGGYLALEVKAQTRFSTPQLAGLRAVAALPRLVRRVLVYLGDRRLKTEDGIDVWPLKTFLDALAKGALWP